MRHRAISRRIVLQAGACGLAATTGVMQVALANTDAAGRTKIQDAVRKYYAAWESKHWQSIDAQLTDDFTFSSPVDDHISKSAFKTGCWDTQIAYIDRFDLKQVIGADNDAFVLYVCRTANGKTFQNVEYFQFRDGKVKSVECYFGGKSTFPSAVSSGQG